MLNITDIRIAVKTRYFPGLGTQVKGMISATIQSDTYSSHKETMAFSGTIELLLNAKFLRTYQDLSSNDDILKLFKDISISKLDSDGFSIRPEMIDTQLSELKLFSSILLAIRFPTGAQYEGNDSYSVFDVPPLAFDNHSPYTLYGIPEYDIRSDIRKQIGIVKPTLLLQEEVKHAQ